MEKELKVGDILICHRVCNLYESEISTTVGNSYIIIGFSGNLLVIKNDNHYDHYFSLDNENDQENYYERWFFNPKLSRKRKLKKIKDEEEIYKF